MFSIFPGDICRRFQKVEPQSLKREVKSRALSDKKAEEEHLNFAGVGGDGAKAPSLSVESANYGAIFLKETSK